MSGRAIHLAEMDRTRPVLVLTRAEKRKSMTNVTVAVITKTIRNLDTEVHLSPEVNGVQFPCVVSLDNIQTIPKDRLKKCLGYLLPEQEELVTAAMHAAFDLK